jgi:hypothetical protein
MTNSTQKPPEFTPRRNGRARAKRHKCLHCHSTFTTARADAKYCSARCRQAAFRARQQAPEQLTPAACAHCGNGFWQTNSLRVYCSASCRTLASRVKRAAAADALAQLLGISGERAADVVDTQGLRKVAANLEACGWAYDRHARSWAASKPAPVARVSARVYALPQSARQPAQAFA